jgi:acylphosphatase
MPSDQLDHMQLHAIVEGRVQGVGFRYFVLQNAMQLGLTGWVRNTWDDNVEVCAEGNQSDLETLAAMLRSGPRSANVISLRSEWQPASGKFSSFKVTPTS